MKMRFKTHHRWALGVLLVPVGLGLALVGNTFLQASQQAQPAALAQLKVDTQLVAQNLAGAIRARTIAQHEPADANADQFRSLHSHLQKAFPAVHSSLQREVLPDLSLLYTLRGSDPQLKPILLMAHQDVVPVSPGTESTWKHDPFAGVVADDYVWGRGAWDNKGNLIAQMQALELLLQSGFKPRRTIYLAHGADEELGGKRGAAQMAALLASRGVRLEFTLDEGLVVTEGVMPGVLKPAALVGVAEKGFVTFDLQVNVDPGHASMPPPAAGEGAVAILSSALKKLDANPMPARMDGVVRDMFSTLAPEMSGVNRVVLSNLWLLKPVVQGRLEKAPTTNAMLRSTTALTMLRAGDAENVLPGQASAVVNYRLAPGDSIQKAFEHVRYTIADERVGIKARAASAEPSPVSSTSSASYRLIEQTIRDVMPDTVVAPGLLIGGTDSRYFLPISEQVFRFSPVRTRPEDLGRFHGTNERISTANLVEMVRFYHRLLDQAAK